MFRPLRVAAISFKPGKFELADNCDRLEESFRRAARDGAELAVAPEGVIEGYVTNEIIAGEAPAARILEVAVTMQDAVISRFRALARELGMSLAFGCAEKVGRNVHNCAVFIDPAGKLCGKYHKMQLAEGTHPAWWFNRLGRQSRAFPTPHGRCGFMICADRWNADIARIPVLDGARYLLIPSFGSRSRRQDQAVLARARENGVPIVEANVGVTLIISQGEIVALSRREEKILHATIEIPAEPCRRNRDLHERAFLRWRRKEMPLWFEKRTKKTWLNRVRSS